MNEAEGIGRIDLAAFWARRMRRLIPAASIVLISCLAFSIYLLPETQWISAAGQIVSSALYVQNWTLAAQSIDYMAGKTPTPVQHYWSLSIEEQFYILWPLLLSLACFFVRRKRFVPIAFLGTAFLVLVPSLAFSILKIGSASGYFETTTRAWELAIGGILSVALNRGYLPLAFRTLLGWIGLLSLAASGAIIKGDASFPGWIALLPTLGTGAVIASGDHKWSPVRLMNAAPIQFLGDISYSLYLWHWPVLLLLRAFLVEELNDVTGIIVIATSLFLATVTKYGIEDPFRTGGISIIKSRKSLWPTYAICGAMILVTVGCAGAFLSNRLRAEEALSRTEKEHPFQSGDANYPGAAAFDSSKSVTVPPNVPVKPDPLVAKYDLPVVYSDGCEMRQVGGARICQYGNPTGEVTIALTGDSHAIQYLPALEALGNFHKWRIITLSKSACTFSGRDVKRGGVVVADCDLWQKQAIELLIQAKPSVVITSAALPVIYSEVYQLPAPAEQVAGYKELWGKLELNKIPVAIIRDNPRPWWDVPTCVAGNRMNPSVCNKPRSQILDNHEDVIARAAREMNLKLFDFSNYFCKGDECPAVVGNVLVYRDGDHLSATFVKTLAPYLEAGILEILKKKD